jgi:uncharacterized membrane protein YhaH (DUF805 family)
MNDADRRELWVIAVAMIFFLVICVTAVALFVRQWRRERGRKGAKADERERR